MILGKDFLLKHNVGINGNVISIGGADQSYCKITQQITIPSNSEMVVSASTSGVTSVNRMMEPVMIEPVFKSDKEIMVARSIFQTQNNKMNALVQNHSNKPISLFQNTIFGNSFDECNALNSCIKTKREEAGIDEIEKHNKAFSFSEYDLGALIKQAPYSCPRHLRPVMEEKIKELLNHDLIEPSESPWSYPVVLVRKKEGTIRFCVDFRKLNANTLRDAYLLPKPAKQIEILASIFRFWILHPVFCKYRWIRMTKKKQLLSSKELD